MRKRHGDRIHCAYKDAEASTSLGEKNMPLSNLAASTSRIMAGITASLQQDGHTRRRTLTLQRQDAVQSPYASRTLSEPVHSTTPYSRIHEAAQFSGFLRLHASDLVFNANTATGISYAQAVINVHLHDASTATIHLILLDNSTNVTAIHTLDNVKELDLALENYGGFSETNLIALALVVWQTVLKNRNILVITPHLHLDNISTVPFSDYATSIGASVHVQPRPPQVQKEECEKSSHMLSRLMFCEGEPVRDTVTSYHLMKLKFCLSSTWLNKLCSCFF